VSLFTIKGDKAEKFLRKYSPYTVKFSGIKNKVVYVSEVEK